MVASSWSHGSSTSLQAPLTAAGGHIGLESLLPHIVKELHDLPACADNSAVGDPIGTKLLRHISSELRGHSRRRQQADVPAAGDQELQGPERKCGEDGPHIGGHPCGAGWDLWP